MNNTLFFVLVSIILIASFIIGNKSSRNIKNETDYFLSGRNLGFFSVFMTLLATQLGGGAIIGTAEAAYLYGWKAISYSAGVALGLLFLGLGIGAKFRKMNISTIPELFQTIYQSKNLRVFASLLYIISTFLLLVAIGVSARKYAVSLGYDSAIIFIVFWGTIIAYTTTGGLTAVTKTDVLQIIFVLIAFIITFISLSSGEKIPLQNSPKELIDDIPWINWIIIPCLSNMIGQDMAQRCFASRSPKLVPYAMIAAAIFLVISTMLPTYLGILAYSMPSLEPGSTVLIQVVSELTNPYVTSLFSAAILMAILSTADSVLCALSSNISLDFKFLKIFSEKNHTKLSKLITTSVGIAAMVGSFFSEEIIPLMISSYEVVVSILFVPIMGALLLNNPSRNSATNSCIVGSITFLYFTFFSNYPYKALVSILISLIIFTSTEVLSRRKSR